MNSSQQNLSLIGMMRQRSAMLLWASITLGALAGVGFSFIIPCLISAMQSKATTQASSNQHSALLYFLLCIGIFVCKSSSLITMTLLVKDLVVDMRIRLCKKINRISVRDVE